MDIPLTYTETISINYNIYTSYINKPNIKVNSMTIKIFMSIKGKSEQQ